MDAVAARVNQPIFAHGHLPVAETGVHRALQTIPDNEPQGSATHFSSSTQHAHLRAAMLMSDEAVAKLDEMLSDPRPVRQRPRPWSASGLKTMAASLRKLLGLDAQSEAVINCLQGVKSRIPASAKALETAAVTDCLTAPAVAPHRPAVAPAVESVPDGGDYADYDADPSTNPTFHLASSREASAPAAPFGPFAPFTNGGVAGPAELSSLVNNLHSNPAQIVSELAAEDSQKAIATNALETAVSLNSPWPAVAKLIGELENALRSLSETGPSTATSQQLKSIVWGLYQATEHPDIFKAAHDLGVREGQVDALSVLRGAPAAG